MGLDTSLGVNKFGPTTIAATDHQSVMFDQYKHTHQHVNLKTDPKSFKYRHGDTQHTDEVVAVMRGSADSNKTLEWSTVRTEVFRGHAVLGLMVCNIAQKVDEPQLGTTHTHTGSRVSISSLLTTHIDDFNRRDASCAGTPHEPASLGSANSATR